MLGADGRTCEGGRARSTQLYIYLLYYYEVIQAVIAVSAHICFILMHMNSY